MKKKYESRVTCRDSATARRANHESRREAASALILAVVLTSLLAIIGTMFLMVARVDKIATSAITENKELQFALESIVAEISQQLALDVPGNDPNQEYYDYPDPCNAFLASLEPYQSGSYYWRQISDVTGYIRDRGWGANNIPTVIIPEHNDISLFSGSLKKQRADADGDGVSDSIWIELNNGMTTSKGKPIFAAVRIIDNGGMLNVNTAYKFDPAETIGRIDGSSQMQINLAALSQRGANGTLNVAANNLQAVRCGSVPPDISAYEQNVIWRYDSPLGAYTPFDISDELELRNRFTLNRSDVDSRIEVVWTSAFRGPNYLRVPVGSSSSSTLSAWFEEVYYDWSDPNAYDNYSYRHIGTTYNMDRIITPDGPILNYGKMLNVNRIDPNNNADPNIFDLYNYIQLGFADANFFDDSIAAQLAVNIKDFSDSDAIVSSLDLGGPVYYGFEAQPFISEIGIIIDSNAPDDSANNHFAVELYNPFNKDIPLDDFILSLSNGPNIPLSGVIGPNKFFVIVDDLRAFRLPKGVNWQVSSDLKLSGNYVDVGDDGTFEIWDNYNITLKRTNVGGTDTIFLDNQETDNLWFAQGTVKYVQRDDTYWHIVYEDVNDSNSNPDTLGFTNNYRTTATNYNLALANHDFNTIGDIALPLKIGPNTAPNGTIGRKLSLFPFEDEIRINLTLPAYQYIFNYLTVMDPAEHISDPNIINETRVKGRININTAPWFVIAQLPWVSYHTPNYELAKAIVAYRDTNGAFKSIGELNNVVAADPNYSIDYYSRDFVDQFGFPDLTFDPITFLDGAPDDFEERDLIFARISNLVTVRSDVFTAYILIRIGVDGPQKRAIAILDRSKVNDVTDRVKLIALHPVPDPR